MQQMSKYNKKKKKQTADIKNKLVVTSGGEEVEI